MKESSFREPCTEIVPKFIAKRLVIRDFELVDAPDLAENLNHPDVSRYMSDVPHPFPPKLAERWIQYWMKLSQITPRSEYELAIELSSEKRIVGAATLTNVNRDSGTASIAYWLGKRYWGQGIASEALGHVIEFAFGKLGLQKLGAELFVDNHLSERLLRKFGFRHQTTLKNLRKSRATGKTHDAHVYELPREEWISRKEENGLYDLRETA